jgi:hypothetical protein
MSQSIETGTASSLQDLHYKIRVFLGKQGFIVTQGEAVHDRSGRLYFEIGYRPGHLVSTELSSDGRAFDALVLFAWTGEQIGFIVGQEQGQPSNELVIAFPVSYEMRYDPDINNFHCQVGSDPNLYQWLCFGETGAGGSPKGGIWAGTTFGCWYRMNDAQTPVTFGEIVSEGFQTFKAILDMK